MSVEPVVSFEKKDNLAKCDTCLFLLPYIKFLFYGIFPLYLIEINLHFSKSGSWLFMKAISVWLKNISRFFFAFFCQYSKFWFLAKIVKNRKKLKKKKKKKKRKENKWGKNGGNLNVLKLEKNYENWANWEIFRKSCVSPKVIFAF